MMMGAVAVWTRGDDDTGHQMAAQQFTNALQSGDASQVEMAVTSLQRLVEKAKYNSRGRQLDNGWFPGPEVALSLPELVKLKRFDEVEQFSIAGFEAFPSRADWLEGYQIGRVQARLAQGNGMEALAEAKRLYNICALSSTPQAIEQICQCLQSAYGEEKGAAMARRFRLEQAQRSAAPTTQQAELGRGMLDQIKVDPKPLATALDQARDRRGPKGMLGLGNLLLLADQPDEALHVFKKAYAAGIGDDETAAIDGIARAMRAQSGSTGKANAYLRSQQARASGK
jgi:hypothetical protein